MTFDLSSKVNRLIHTNYVKYIKMGLNSISNRNLHFAHKVKFKMVRLLFSFLNFVLFVVSRRKFSDSITEMLVVCATTVHRVGLKTAPNELCPRVSIMAWNTCAFTIQAIGTASVGFCHSFPLHVFMCARLKIANLHRKHTGAGGQAAIWFLTEQTGTQ